jgi:Flp pilus assembly pilin Flp
MFAALASCNSRLIPHASFPAGPDASYTPDGALESTEGGDIDMIRDFFRRLRIVTLREEGQTMAEYGVVLAVITIGVVVALGLLSGDISAAINSVRTHL